MLRNSPQLGPQSPPRSTRTNQRNADQTERRRNDKSIALFLYLQFYPMLKKLNITRCSRSLKKNSKR